jgi:photosystem II stability/assembly factor-like uncharacterized protein
LDGQRHLRLNVLFGGLGVIAILVLAGRAAYASIPGPNGAITGCFEPKSGNLRHASGTLAARTADGGRNWHRGGRPPDALSFTWLQPISQRSGWALGTQVKAGPPGGELLRTDDAADHWSAIPLDR